MRAKSATARRVKELKRAHEIGNHAGRGLATGQRKTRVAADDAKDVGPSRPVLAHTTEILDVAQSELKLSSEHEVARISEIDPSSLRVVNLATVQSFEAHRGVRTGHVHYGAVTNSPLTRSHLSRHFRSLTPNFLLGLTATPFARIGRHLAALRNNTIVSYELWSASSQACSFRIIYWLIDQVDYSQVHVEGGRFSPRDLSACSSPGT